MLNEVFYPRLIIPSEDGVVIVHELLPHPLVGLGLEELVDLDVIDEVIVLGDKYDQGDEEIDGDYEEDHD